MSIEEQMLNELLGAYALDAVDDDERRAVDEYLRVSPAAAAEVRAHREVASMLSWNSSSAPAGLWDRIAGSLEGEAPQPSGDLARVMPINGGRRRSWAVGAAAWVATAAAAAALAVVVVRSVDNGASTPLVAAYEEARDDRESSSATLIAEGSATAAAAVVDSRGHGYVDARSLPALSADQTYQLWGVIGEQVISLGVLGRSPEIETFSVDGGLSTLVITIEPAGGVVSNGNPDGAYVGTLG